MRLIHLFGRQTRLLFYLLTIAKSQQRSDVPSQVLTLLLGAQGGNDEIREPEDAVTNFSFSFLV